MNPLKCNWDFEQNPVAKDVSLFEFSIQERLLKKTFQQYRVTKDVNFLGFTL